MTISAFYGLKLDLKGLKAAWLNGKSIVCSTQTRLVFLTCPFKRLTVRFFCLYLKAVKNGRTLNGSTSTKIRILPQINHQWTSLPKLSKPSVSLHAMMTPSTACAWVILARMKDRFQWLTKDEDKDKVNLYDKIVSTIYCISLTPWFQRWRNLYPKWSDFCLRPCFNQKLVFDSCFTCVERIFPTDAVANKNVKETYICLNGRGPG